jgi:hypothetical protein
MFEKEAEIYALSNFGFRGKDSQRVLTAKIDYQYGAEFGYNKGKNEAKEIMNIAIEGIKNWGFVGGTERPFEKQAEMLFNLFLDKAEQFLKDSEIEK